MKNPDIHRIIRVNQAGEYGATRIYAGQLAVLKNSSISTSLNEMYQQETAHLKKFNELAVQEAITPTLFQPVWYVGGYLLGAITALLGEKSAHACTIAVEEVIADHYQQQITQLEGIPSQNELKEIITQFRQEEIDHKDHAIEEGGLQAPGYSLLSTVVKSISKTAIWISERI